MRYLAVQSSRLGDRRSNQDRCAILKKNNTILLLLADGMGGRRRGELAAQKFIDVMSAAFQHADMTRVKAADFLRRSILRAHSEIRLLGRNRAQTPCTTCVCCLVHENHASWAHCGDSRLYQIRNNEILFRTEDHSYIAHLIRHKALRGTEARAHPMRHYVTSCLGIDREIPHLSIQLPVPLLQNDVLLLCSDGLWHSTPAADLCRLGNCRNLEQQVETLLDQVTRRDYPRCDNVSAVVFKLISATCARTTTHAEAHSAGPESELERAVLEIETAWSRYQQEIDKK